MSNHTMSNHTMSNHTMSNALKIHMTTSKNLDVYNEFAC